MKSYIFYNGTINRYFTIFADSEEEAENKAAVYVIEFMQKELHEYGLR